MPLRQCISPFEWSFLEKCFEGENDMNLLLRMKASDYLLIRELCDLTVVTIWQTYTIDYLFSIHRLWP